MSDLLPLMGLWKCESKSGRIYWRGRLGDCVVMMFRNGSTNPKAPEFNIVLAKYLSPEEREKQAAEPDPPGPDPEYSEIPF